MKNLHNWIIIIIFVIVLVHSFLMQKRYDALQKNYNELLFDKSTVIDSLEKDNIAKLETISILESEIHDLNYKIDSLYDLKSKVLQSEKKFEISNSISEGSKLLKQNLHEKNINGLIYSNHF